MDGANPIGSAALDANGQATLNTAALSAGTHTLTAVYSGDSNFGGSQTAGASSLLVTTVPLLFNRT